MAIRDRTLGELEMRHHATPALLAISLLDLLARPQTPLCHPDHEAALKHEGAAARSNLDRLELGGAGALVAVRVGAVAAHDIVQRRAAGNETAGAGLLGVVRAADEAHELTHRVAVVPRRAEGVLAHEPARREDDKVGDGGSGHRSQRREHGEDGRVWVVKGDGADGVEAAEVVLVRVVVALPGDHVKRRVGLRRLEERVVELDRHEVLVWALVGRRAKVLAEAGNGSQEVSRVGEAVGTDGTKLWKTEVAFVQLQGVSAGWARGEADVVLDAAGDHGNLHLPDEQPPELGADIEIPLLGNNQQVAVGRVKG